MKLDVLSMGSGFPSYRHDHYWCYMLFRLREVTYRARHDGRWSR